MEETKLRTFGYLNGIKEDWEKCGRKISKGRHKEGVKIIMLIK